MLLQQLCYPHFLILLYPDHHRNLISSSLYHKISAQSTHNYGCFKILAQTHPGRGDGILIQNFLFHRFISHLLYTFSKSPVITGLQKKSRDTCFHVRYKACCQQQTYVHCYSMWILHCQIHKESL